MTTLNKGTNRVLRGLREWLRNLKYDRRKVAQELECNFLGSGDNVFDSEMMTDIAQNQVKEPQAKMMGGGLWIFKEPKYEREQNKIRC